MKMFLLAASGFLVTCRLQSADPSSLVFGGEKIGVPPLSLSERSTRTAVVSGPNQFGTGLPGAAAGPNVANLGPNLLSRQTLNLAPDQRGRSTRGPSVSREFGMPILTPGDAIDYKIVIVRPNPDIDPKMIVPVPGAPKPPSTR